MTVLSIKESMTCKLQFDMVSMLVSLKLLSIKFELIGIGIVIVKAASVNLKRKIKLNDNWVFVPVARKNGRYLRIRF